MQAPSEFLVDLGRRVLTPYSKLPGVACVAQTGSSVEGHSDHHSDIDSTVYYDTMPPEADILAVREALGGERIWLLGNYADGEFMESFRVRGVEVQVGHTTVAKWEADMARILAGEEPGSPLHKAMSGTLISVPIFGAARLSAWQDRIREYPQALRLAMVRHHLKFFPIWGVLNRTYTRDAALWMRQVLVESSYNIVGVCAGLSRRYFTSFQFKRTRLFIEDLAIRPDRLYERLEGLWHVPIPAAAQDLKGLVADTVALVERELPEVDTGAARKAMVRDDKPWA